MNLRHNYYWFKSALDSDTCDRIKELGVNNIPKNANTFGDNSKHNLPEAEPQTDKTLSEIKDKETYVRDSKVSWLNDQWLYDTIIPFVNEANHKAGWGWDIDSYEDFQFTVYDKDGFYGWHQDGSSDHFGKMQRYIYGITDEPLKENGDLPDGYTKSNYLVGKVRKISLTINLNEPDEYEGGNLKFDFGNHDKLKFHEVKEIRPKGSIIVFPSFLPHCITPITRGTRYSLVLWCTGKPWK